ncbi:hypothetical protein NB311A_09356 [Nitrobacter sp. Nb-311A]|nr:hypothetical protein NB311A_09356 [Nitrobacter sp. Nb-311A]
MRTEPMETSDIWLPPPFASYNTLSTRRPLTEQ